MNLHISLCITYPLPRQSGQEFFGIDRTGIPHGAAIGILASTRNSWLPSVILMTRSIGTWKRVIATAGIAAASRRTLHFRFRIRMMNLIMPF